MSLSGIKRLYLGMTVVLRSMIAAMTAEMTVVHMTRSTTAAVAVATDTVTEIPVSVLHRDGQRTDTDVEPAVVAVIGT